MRRGSQEMSLVDKARVIITTPMMGGRTHATRMQWDRISLITKVRKYNIRVMIDHHLYSKITEFSPILVCRSIVNILPAIGSLFKTKQWLILYNTKGWLRHKAKVGQQTHQHSLKWPFFPKIFSKTTTRSMIVTKWADMQSRIYLNM